MNHVVTTSEESNSTVKCQIDTIDSILGDNVPNLIKIDVEGYEFAVIEGASRTLA